VSSGIPLRLLKFSLVGAVGVGVQLGMLALLTAAGIGYLWATGLAVESAVLHNFFWHLGFTWPDRRRHDLRWLLHRLLRFHVANGLISVAGNVVVMRLLVGELNLPLLPANIAAISVCFVANFVTGDRWVFQSL
jgi:putative flippase GtrA